MLLAALSEFVAERMGLCFPQERWGDLERGISSAASELRMGDVATCIRWLMSSEPSREKLEILASHLTIGETYFFREKKTFETLEKHVLPELISARKEEKRLRIWSAGCATGEEAYSIAILLSKVIPDLEAWHIYLLATDINQRFLDKARNGAYSQWSFRDTPEWLAEKYFKKSAKGRLELIPIIKQMVTFSYLNLAEDSYPSLITGTNAMDVIFCRNVLMYFVPERTKKVISNFKNSLVEGGWLIPGQTEVSQSLFPDLSMTSYTGVILYRKADNVPVRMLDLSTPVEFPADLVPEPIPVHIQGSTYEEIEQEAVKEESGKTPYSEALALYNVGRYSEAEAIIKSCSEDSDSFSLLARTCANQGKIQEALAWCQKAIAGDKLNPVYRYLMATILQEVGQVDQSVALLKQALYLGPDFVLAHFTLGSLYLRRKKRKESLKYFENALSLLSTCSPEDILPESEGMSAGRLKEIILTTRQKGTT